MPPFSRKNKEEKIKLSKENWKKAMKIFGFLKPYRLKYFLGMIFLFLTGGAALVFPYLMGDLVDAGSAASAEQINQVALLLMIVLIAQAVFSFFRIYLFADVTENMLADIRQSVYEHIIKLPVMFFNKNRVGELNSRISSDVALLQETFTTTIAEFLRQFILIVGGVFLLFYTSPKLAGVMLSIVPVVVIAGVFFGRFIRKISRQVQDEIARSNTIVEETLQGILTVKAFANELFEIMRYKKAVQQVKQTAIKGARWRGAFASFIIFCLFGAIVTVIWYAMHLVQLQELTYGKMFRFLLLSVFVGASIGGIAELYAQIQRAVGATDRIMDILEEKTEPINPHDEIKQSVKGEIEFREVCFSYPSRPDVQVLNKVSFKIEPGQQVALVGPSGAGKSTVTQLLFRFYEPQSGEILIDRKNINSYDLTDLRKQIAIVPQEVLLFGGTIKENIAYGKPGASEAEIEEAAKKANAYEFIMQFPDKFETLVGERGVQLSGGQRQRIAIARAILKNPKILILDEATSSLDSQSEKEVQESLNYLMQGRTSLVIAHRLSTIKNSDKILVIQNGKIIEEGTHVELIKKGGLYNNLLQLQNETIVS
ncbi:MAG: ATP-binding cassette domain-containing protein [Bacteroidetes bacterium]|nr:MAG: ATP-binding cassette domain-containing protein [Bacteroidota bacterium]